MNRKLRSDGYQIIDKSIRAVLPDEAVRRALQHREFTGRIILIAIGKAAWQMAKTAGECLGDKIEAGIIITKYGHIKGKIRNVICCEAGHPVPDENSFTSTQIALELVKGLTADDTVLFLVSGGGSALFEAPLVPAEELQYITGQLLASGADITEMNVIRKRLSAVKGGRFAKLCAPARVYSVILSDIIGDPLDMIASGPASPDPSTSLRARKIAVKYHLNLSETAWRSLEEETPKVLDNVESYITGSVRELCFTAAEVCRELGYAPTVLTDRLCCQAKEAGSFLASIARSHANSKIPLAFIAGGETVVKVTGTGKGGRNQELALAAAEGIAGLDHVLLFSFGSDGTDGPTDAAGGIVDGDTAQELKKQGLDIYEVLEDNNAYEALKKTDSLIFTGPTGTNVNDVAVLLIKCGALC